MSVGAALVISTDSAVIRQFSHALQEFSIAPDVCRELATARHLLNHRKFEAVIVDLQLGQQAATILDDVRLSPSNRTSVTFLISQAGDAIRRCARGPSSSSNGRFRPPLSAVPSNPHAD